MLKIALVIAFVHNLIFVLSYEMHIYRPKVRWPCSSSETSEIKDDYALKHPFISCDFPPSVDHLKRSFAGLIGIMNLEIEIRTGILEEIPSDLFKGLDVFRLYFDNNRTERFGDKGRSSFEGLEDSLQELRIRDRGRIEYPLKYFNVTSLKNIHTLKIVNEVPALGNEWFETGPKSLKDLQLSGCRIKEIGDRAFEKLVNLERLILTGNTLVDIRRSMFPSPAPYLKELELSNNHISSLPEDMFVNMPSLAILNLSRNQIARLPEDTWARVWSRLQHLYIDGNSLVCDSHMKWMFQMRRPKYLGGSCAAPEHYKEERLATIIDRN